MEDHLRFSADLPASPGVEIPPGPSEIERVRDVAIISAEGAGADVPSDLVGMPQYSDPTRGPTPAQPIELGRGLRMLRLDQAEGERVLEACTPRGHFFRPIRQFGQSFVIECEVPTLSWEEHLYRWDVEGLIGEALMMSRYVLDNGYSAEYAARIIDHADGTQRIAWMPNRRPVYRLREDRDWMTTGEATELAELLGNYWTAKETLPKRVRQAIWDVEYLTTIPWIDEIGPMLGVVFERLLNTSNDRVSRQFRERVPRVASEAGASQMDEDLCRWLYKVRSDWAHEGRGTLRALRRFQEPDSKQDLIDRDETSDDDLSAVKADFERAQSALRRILRLAIEDATFRAHLENRESIRTQWPVLARVQRDGREVEVKL